MRRKEFLAGMPAAIEIFAKSKYGMLGIIDRKGYPRSVPLNFVYHADAIYFHGALAGEKFEVLSAGADVSFLAFIPYSEIPGDFTEDKSPCNVTVYFKSANMRGKGSLVTDPAEKVSAIVALYTKYYPASPGGAKPSFGKTALDEVGVFKVEPVDVDVKEKFGQNISASTRENIARKLEERGIGPDADTAREIRHRIPR